MKKAALLSVSNREGLEVFAKGLIDLDYVLLTTAGTGKYLAERGIPYVSVEEYTGQKEIMDGRVKTLHPKIYAGLLARRNNAQDMHELEVRGILPVDVAAVNLYPFAANVGSTKDQDGMIELIDIGGPSMIRAAAKNFKYVLPVIDPADYEAVVSFLSKGCNLPSAEADLAFRRRLAIKVFAYLAYDSLEIASYFSNQAGQDQPDQIDLRTSDQPMGHCLGALSEVNGLVLFRKQVLRYGENPHQRAVFYQPAGLKRADWRQLGGKELSYNNLLDVDSVVRILRDLPVEPPKAVIVKHLNPCGAASADTQLQALRYAKRCDSRSHFGGIIGFSQAVGVEVAREIREDFAEVVVAPAFEAQAVEVLKQSKNLRVVQVGMQSVPRLLELRSVLDGVLVQESDRGAADIASARLVTQRQASPAELEDLKFAWTLCAHVKSNAVVIVKNKALIGVGAGQTSRIDSVEVALMKAKYHGHDLEGAVAASDAFFPFVDGVEALAHAGVSAVIAPEGARRDAEVVAAAERLGISLFFVVDRHFRH